MARGEALRVVGVALALALVPDGAALAQLATPASDPHARVLGAGFGVGIGAQQGTRYVAGIPAAPSTLACSIGSLELMAFVDPSFSIDVSAQLWLTLVDLAYGAYAWTSTVYFDWSFGSDVRFVVGPGVGVSAYARPSDPTAHGGAELRAAALLGLEALTSDARFGFRAVTRPWLSLGGGDAGFDVGYGAMLEIAFLFYTLG